MRVQRNRRYLLATASLCVFSAVVVARASAEAAEKLQGMLRQALVLRGERAVEGFRPARRVFQYNRAGQVQAYVVVTDTSEEKLARLAQAGLHIDLVDHLGKVVQGWIPTEAATPVAQLPFVKVLREPDYLHTNSGSFESEGDAILGADRLREQTGVDGTGVKVGVISDGVFGLLEAVSTGDLPAGSKVCGNAGSPTRMTGVGVQCRSFRADGDITAGGDGTGRGAEGTALLEIIHDIAPGAELFFANAATTIELGQAQDWLADTVGVDIMLDDLAAFNVGPYDGTSSISRKTSSQVSKGKVYVNAVGNYGNSHYVGWFTDRDGDGLHEFDASMGLPAVDGAGETLDILIPAVGSSTVYISWNEPFGSASHDCSAALVFPADCAECNLREVLGFDPCSDNVQAGAGDPVEICAIAREETPAEVGLTIQGCPGVELQIFVTGEGDQREFVVPERSVPNNSDARDVISVGAVGVTGDGIGGSPLLVRSYSSRGPTDDGRIKPAVAAPDGVAISGAGGFGIGVGGATRFFGTSGAAPHVAGVAALLKALDPGAGPSCIAEKLGYATDLGIVGPDSTYGAGRVDAVLASAGACSNGFCENLCCDLDGDCRECAEPDCEAILAAALEARTDDCRADILASAGGAVDLFDATLCLRRRAGLAGQSSCSCTAALGPARSTARELCGSFTGHPRRHAECLWVGASSPGSRQLSARSLSDGVTVLFSFLEVKPALFFRAVVTSPREASLEAVGADLNDNGEFDEGEVFGARGELSLSEDGSWIELRWAGEREVSLDGRPFGSYRGAFHGAADAVGIVNQWWRRSGRSPDAGGLRIAGPSLPPRRVESRVPRP